MSDFTISSEVANKFTLYQASSRIIRFMDKGADRITIDFDKNTIEIAGDWDEAAKFFIQLCRNLLVRK